VPPKDPLFAFKEKVVEAVVLDKIKNRENQY